MKSFAIIIALIRAHNAFNVVGALKNSHHGSPKNGGGRFIKDI
jgi:hypothetical protein